MWEHTRGLAIAVAISCLVGAAVSGQDESSPTTTFRSKLSVVSVPVTVTRSGTPVAGLQRDQFHVFERGVEQPITVFGAGEVPVDLVMLVDSSGSMGALLPSVQHAARILSTGLHAQDRAAVVSFGGRIRQVAQLTSDRKVVNDAIGRVTAGGNTPLYDAVYFALKQFGIGGDGVGLRRRALVVLSDAGDSSSLMSFETVMELARQTGVAVYTIIVPSTTSSTDRRSSDEYEMRLLARETGAQAFFPRDNENLDSVYGAVAQELANQYALGFVPADPTARGFIKVSVTVDDRNVVVRTRTGYIAGS